MKPARLCSILIAASFAITIYAASPNKAERELMKRDMEWSAISSKGKDAAKIVAFWTDDAYVYQDRGPTLHGKSEIIKFVKGSLATPGFHISWKPDHATVSGDRTVGYTTGTNTMTFPGQDGKLMTVTGRYVTTWVRKHGGPWRCSVDIWNSDH